MVHFFSIDGERARHRLDAWQGIISDTFVSLDCKVPNSVGLRGSVTTMDAGPVSMTRVDTMAQSVHRTPPLIRKDDAEVVLVSCQLQGEGLITQNGNQVRLRAGDFTIYDSTRPYSLHFDGAFQQLVLHMPRDILRRRVGPIHEQAARSFRSDNAAFAAASGYLQGLGASLNAAGTTETDPFGHIALDLISLAVGPRTGRPRTWRRTTSAIREQARQSIRRQFSDPALSTPSIARVVGVSPRRLQEAFAEIGETPMQALWEHRLTTAANRLVGQHGVGDTITDVAYLCGFADSAQFSRRFRDRFSCSPSDWRLRNDPW